jgi:histidinol-phosphate aminotransferase
MNITVLARPEIVAMKPYSSARKEAPAQGVLLNANESPWPLLENDEVAETFMRTGKTGLNRYPEPQPPELLSRLADHFGLPADHLLVTRGSDEGIDLLTRVFCRAGKDAILQCPPTFGMYKISAETQGADIVSVPRRMEDGFRMDEERTRQALRDNDLIRLVYLTSPNNPTGDTVSTDCLKSLLEQADGQALVVVDEAYAEFCSQPSASGLLANHENLVVLRTLSKAWAAAGLRCGVVLAQPAVISLLRRIIAPYPLSGPVITLALRMLEADVLMRQQHMLRALAKNKQRLLEILRDRAFIKEIWPGEANFVLIQVDDAESLMQKCAEGGVILRGFPADPRLQDCIRISVGSDGDLSTLATVLDFLEA